MSQYMPENLTQSITKTMNQYLPVRLTQYAPDMAALNYRIQASIPTYKTVSKYIPTYIADVINAYTSVPADPDEALPYTWHPIDETSRNVCTVGPNSALFNCSREKLFEHMPTPEFAKAGLNLDVVWLTPIGPQARRTVQLGPVKGEEQFIGMQHNESVSFYFKRASFDWFKSFAEYWTVEAVDEHTSRLTWVVKFEMKRYVFLSWFFSLFFSLIPTGVFWNMQGYMYRATQKSKTM